MINNLTIRNKDQVMLRVTVMEVSRNVIKQFGVNLNGNWSAINPLGNIADPSLTASATHAFPISGGSTAAASSRPRPGGRASPSPPP